MRNYFKTETRPIDVSSQHPQSTATMWWSTEDRCQADGTYSNGASAVVLRRDEHGQPVSAVQGGLWRGGGSAAQEGDSYDLAVADHAWTVTLVEPVAGAGRVLQATDEEGRVWVFMARSPAEGDAAGHTTLIADYDGDGQPDQVRVTPGRHDSAVMMAYLASGAVHRVADLPRGAEVLLAQRGRQWRNADGSVLVVPPGRDAVLVSTEPAPGRSDVVVYLYENGRWRAWEYAPD